MRETAGSFKVFHNESRKAIDFNVFVLFYCLGKPLPTDRAVKYSRSQSIHSKVFKGKKGKSGGSVVTMCFTCQLMLQEPLKTEIHGQISRQRPTQNANRIIAFQVSDSTMSGC